MARITFDASQHEMLDVHLSESTDRGVTLRRTLSFLELIREEVKQRTFQVRQYAELESLYRGTTGWRQALIFSLLHGFADPMYLEAQQADEEEKQSLRKLDFDCEAPGEREHQELLRLLEEEIGSVREEFGYAEKANEERAAIERDACLAPEGETWRLMLRQEAALDHSIDRKVRILLRLRKDAADHLVAPPSQDDGAGMENTEEIVASDISPDNSQSAGTVEELKLNDQCGNVYENKGPLWKTSRQSGNVVENKHSYAQDPGMLLKTEGVIASAESHATSKWPSSLPVSDDGRSLR
jgi:hypothetical protein